MSKTLIYVSGPTGIGKTSLSIELAKKLKTEIISCDSRQFYKELKIGTSPPTDKQLKEVNHHFIFNKSIIDNYNVGDYERDSIDVINNLFKTREYLILVGGSGLYADSILFGIDNIPKVPIEIKNKLNLRFKKDGLIYLQDKLKEIDLEYYKTVDLNNPSRLVRAIGVYEVSGKKISSLRKNSKKKRNFNSSVIMIKANRDKLYERINQRVDKMIKDGLEEEANGLVKFKEYNALNTVGYKEFFLYFDGKLSKEEAINKIKQNTRNYAKRQITWFKKYNDALGYKIDDNIDELLNKIPKNE
ncbi:MAG TPA: tRNA (adenosine(37)-N6)-dimethylallyltransferase MiaA [Flavobacteriaceae bacterium]|nr:tRNA (adenosine(37)-N6)-dimethylallyltransferase MiaA [Flavobacteriaceae bacterium]